MGNLAAVRAIAILACALIAGFSAGGCGSEEKTEGSPDPAGEPVDAAAKPPSGWRTISNRSAGFTLSVPRSWTVRTRGTATLVRSTDRLIVVTVAADRSRAGRGTPPADYARQAFDALPGFHRLEARRSGDVPHSPYETARIDGSGRLQARKQDQRVVVATYTRPKRVTYTAVAFAADIGGGIPHGRELDTLLASLRGRRPLI